MNYDRIKTIIKKIGIFRIIFLVLLIVSNTFAWFIYATKIDSTVDVKVRAWNVVFEAGDSQVTDTLNLKIESIFPGMDDYRHEVTAYNNSDVTATLSYEILEASIFDEHYITTVGRSGRGEEAVDTDLTSLELEELLRDQYPFSIYILLSDTIINSENGAEVYSLNVVWPYENDNDEEDTLWGVRASTFKEEHPDTPCISVKIKITITQNPE